MHTVIVQKNMGKAVQFFFHIVKDGNKAFEHIAVHIFQHAADGVDAKDHAPAGGGLKHIQHFFPHTPALHKQGVKAKGVGQETQPQQVGVDSAHLAPNGAQIFGSGRHFCAKDLLQGLAIGHAVLKGANAANALYYILIVMEVPTTGQFFQSPMDKADGGDGLNHLFVLQD